MIRNGLPPSISAWVQEFGRAGRDGKNSEAHIYYSDDDIHHVGFWSGSLHEAIDLNQFQRFLRILVMLSHLPMLILLVNVDERNF